MPHAARTHARSGTLACSSSLGVQRTPSGCRSTIRSSTAFSTPAHKPRLLVPATLTARASTTTPVRDVAPPPARDNTAFAGQAPRLVPAPHKGVAHASVLRQTRARARFPVPMSPHASKTALDACVRLLLRSFHLLRLAEDFPSHDRGEGDGGWEADRRCGLVDRICQADGADRL